jgi:glycosyltransferase involved in cell wall biosynthesis
MLRGSSRLEPLRVSIALHESRRLGSGLALMRVLPQLSEWGWSFSVWAPEGGEIADDFRALGVRVVEGPARPFAFSVRGLRARESAGIRALWQYRSAFRQFLRTTQPHVVHANTLLALPEALLARRLGLPVALHVQELPAAGAKRAVALRLARHAAAVAIAAGTPVAELLATAVPRQRIVLAENGVATASPIDEQQLGRRLAVGTVGSASWRKGTELFVDVANRVTRELPGSVFHHVGDWDAEVDRGFMSNLRALAAPLVAEKRLVLHGAVHDPSVLMRGWDVFLLPSRQDPYPLALLEAMAVGVPVVAASVGGIQQMLKGGEAGELLSVESGSVEPAAAADLLLEILRSPARLRKMARSAHSHVTLNNSLAGQAQSMHRAYLTALTVRFGMRYPAVAEANSTS